MKRSSIILSIITSYFEPLFFFNDTATTEIYTLSLHDALPICSISARIVSSSSWAATTGISCSILSSKAIGCSEKCCRRYRSEEHTSELQSQFHLVCRLLLEKKKKKTHRGQQPNTQHRPEPEEV